MLHQRKFNHAHQVEKFMVSIQQKVNRKDKVKVAYKKKNICGLSRVWMREESNNTILLWFSITSDVCTGILHVGWGEEARKCSFDRDLWVVAPWWVMSILCLLAVNLFSQEFAISSHKQVTVASPPKRTDFFLNTSEIFSIYRLESELPENVCNFFNIGFFFFFFRKTGPFGVYNIMYV